MTSFDLLVLLFFCDAAKATYFKLQAEKEKRISRVCSLEWCSSKRWVQTFPKRGSGWFLSHCIPGTCWISVCWAEKKHHYLDGGNINPMRNYVKIYSAGKLGHISLCVCGISDCHIICPYIGMEKDCVNWIYQQLTWKKRLKIFHAFKSCEV